MYIYLHENNKVRFKPNVAKYAIYIHTDSVGNNQKSDKKAALTNTRDESTERKQQQKTSVKKWNN